jgi:predicted outer membrane repeat protein
MIEVGPELADGAWANVVESAAANCTIRFSAGSYRAGARGCNVTLPVNARLEAAPGEAVVIDCQGSGRRHFIVPKGSRSVMEGLTLVNGSSQGDAGCVLVEANASLQIHHSVLSNCRASQRGGGMYVSKGGRVSASDSTFETCVANADGGGVYVSESSLLLERSSMRFCGANRGGAVYGNDSKIVVAGGAYEGNTARAEGGMAYVIQSHLNVTTGAEIFLGKAPRGGAVYARDRSIVDVRVGVTMRDNHASAHGGAVYGHTFSVIKLSENTLLLRNSASDDSGAVHLYAQSSLYASNNVTFQENTAGDDAGAIAMQGAGSSGPPGVIRLERGVVFARNFAKDMGGALYVLGRSAVEVYGDVDFVENSADEGGAIAMHTMDGSDSMSQGTLNIQGGVGLERGVVFARNFAKDMGGALYVLGRSAVEVYGDVDFVENSADEGGAIAMDGSDSMSQGTLNIRGGVSFRDNTALAPGWGGALYLKNLLWARLADGVVFKRNRAGWGGGAVVVLGSILHISDARFHDNLALYGSIIGKGGGLYVHTSAVEIVRSTFSKNSAFKAGAIFARASTLNITDGVVFTRCRSFSAGGVLWMEGRSNVHIQRNVSLTDNQASSGGGAVFIAETSCAYIAHNVKFERNVAIDEDGDGGAIMIIDASTLEVSHTVLFSGNRAAKGGAIASVGTGAAITVQFGVTFSRNEATNTGGAMSIATFEDNSKLDKECLAQFRHGVLIENNTALRGGGGIHLQGCLSYPVHFQTEGDVQILANRAGDSGGGIMMYSFTLVTLGTGARLSYNVAIWWGGGVKLQNAKLLAPDGHVVITGNKASSGAGLHLSVGSESRLVGADISLNVAALDQNYPHEYAGLGAGIFARDMLIGFQASVIVLSGCRLQTNVAESGGGAVCVLGMASLQVHDCKFTENLVRAGQGGAVLSASTVPASFNECSFVRNRAQAGQGCAAVSCGSGGAVAVIGSGQLVLSDSRMQENFAQGDPTILASAACESGGSSGRGGAVLLESSAKATLQDVVLIHNSATGDGGGIAMTDDSSIVLLGLVTLTGNRAKRLGGAMYIGPMKSSRVSSCSIGNLEASDNVAEEGCGGAIFSSRPIACSAGGRTILHRNRAALQGGALVLNEVVMQMFQGHTLEAAYNSAGSNGGAVALLLGAWISAEDRVCDDSCTQALRGDGNCDPKCLNSECNWDDGDCSTHRFENAGMDAKQQCQRSEFSNTSSQVNVCSPVTQSTTCGEHCFTASCDFSRQQCAVEKAHVASCPILDAVVFAALTKADPVVSSLSGGTSQDYGWCHGECEQPDPPPRADNMTGPGRGGGTALALDGHGAWLSLQDLDAAMSESMSHIASGDLTVEVWAKVGGIPKLEGNLRMGLPVGFVLAGSNFAVAMLTDTDNASNIASAWPLVFAGPPPTSASYGQDVVLHASMGRLGDGPDMIPRVEPSRTSWTIAPPGARSVTLLFTEFYLYKSSVFRDLVEVCMCLNTACEKLDECKHFSGGELPPTLTSTTGVMRVVFQASGLVYRTNPGFTAFYAATYDAERLDQDTWHHLAVTVESNAPKARMATVRVYVDGCKMRNQTLLWDTLRTPAFSGALGTAVGRGSPHWQHNPLPFYTEQEKLKIKVESLEWAGSGAGVAGSEFLSSLFLSRHVRFDVPRFTLGRFNGSLDDLRVWQEARAASDILANQERTCADVQTPRLAACYSFEQHKETYFEDGSLRGHVKASTASGASPHLPWCQNANDDSSLIHTCSDCSNKALFSPASWGFCADKPRLPGLGFDYDRTEMRVLASQLTAAASSIIKHFPGCGSLTFNLSHNSAGAHGGAVYVDSCTGNQRCFLDGTGPLSGTRAGIFDENRAHKGGGAFFIACSTFSGACLKAFEPSNKFGFLPSVPKHSFKGNVAAYGDDFASNPAHLRLLDVGEDLTLVPGQQKLLAGAEILDSLRRRCRRVDEVLMVSVCRYAGEKIGGETCSIRSAVSAITYYNAEPETGLIAVAQDFSCPMEYGAVQDIYATVHASLVSFSAVKSQQFRVRCGWCRAGESRQVSADGKSWVCTKCANNEFVMDPNNFVHKCSPCPVQATCDGKTMTPQVGILGQHWKADAATGHYRLVGCPLGYSLDLLSEGHRCVMCSPGSYCTGGDMAPFACPEGSHSTQAAKAQEDCRRAFLVLLKVGMPFGSQLFTEKQVLFRESIAQVAGSSIDNVIILSVSQTEGLRRLEHTDGNVRYDTKSGVEIQLQVAAPHPADAKDVIYALDVDSINSALGARGLPSARILSKARLSTDPVSQSIPQPVLAGMLVSITCLLVGALAAFWWVRTRTRLDEEEFELRKHVARVRCCLGLTRDNGFFMSNESPTWFEHMIRQKKGVIEKRNLEALARLTMLRKFEITHVDALVLAVVDLPWPKSGAFIDNTFIDNTRLPNSSRVDGEANEVFGEDGFGGGGLGDFPSLDTLPRQRNRKQHNPVYEALCSLLLETCENLLSTQILQHLDELNVTGQQLQERGIDMKTLIDSAQGQHAQTSKIIKVMSAEEHNTKHVIMGDIVRSHHRHDDELALELSNTASKVLSPQTLARARKRFAANGLDRLFQHTDGRFSFLRDKILKLRAWYFFDLQLFHELKGMVQKKMDVYSTINHFKYEMFDLDPQGPALKALQSTTASIVRQDHERVQAVRVDAKARQEVATLLKYQSLASMSSMLSRGNRVKGLNEDVFITQLVVRAAALDFEFQVQRRRERGREGKIVHSTAPVSDSRAKERTREKETVCSDRYLRFLCFFWLCLACTHTRTVVRARPPAPRAGHRCLQTHAHTHLNTHNRRKLRIYCGLTRPP